MSLTAATFRRVVIATFAFPAAVTTKSPMLAEPGTVLNVATALSDAGALQRVNVQDWVIDGLRLKEATRYGILLAGCSNVTLQNCTVYRAQASGIIVEVSN